MEEIIKYFTDLGVSRGLAIAYIIVSILIVIMAIAAFVMRIMIFINYFSSNRVKTSNGQSCVDVARSALDKAGLGHIQIKKANIFRAFVFGNCYSITKKTIFLRRSIMNKDSLTAVGVALQKVGVARLCEGDSKMAKTRNYMQIVGLFGPILFLPVILIGMVIDLVLFQSFGVASIISIVIGIIILSAGFIVTLLNIPVEKKANKLALQTIDETSICTAEERKVIAKVLNTYIIAYICDFIVAVLRIVQLILEIVMNSQIKSNN